MAYSPKLCSDSRATDPTGRGIGDECVNGVNPTTGKPADPPDMSWFTEMALRSLVTTARVIQNAQQVVQPVSDCFSQPRNPTCIAGYVGVGSSIASWAGGGLGTLWLADGPTAAATMPRGAAGGAALGGGAGGAAGMIMCASGTGSGGGGPKENGNVSAQVQAKLDAQLARAADEYGNAQVAFDVSYTSGTVSVGPERLDVTGTVAGAMNIALSDSNNLNSFLPGRSTTNAAGDSLVLPNAFRSDTGTIAHEYAHVFTGDTRLSIPSVLNRFGAGMMLADTIADYNNSAGRALLRNWRSPAVRALRLIDPFLEQRRQLINQRARQWFGVR